MCIYSNELKIFRLFLGKIFNFEERKRGVRFSELVGVAEFEYEIWKEGAIFICNNSEMGSDVESGNSQTGSDFKDSTS